MLYHIFGVSINTPPPKKKKKSCNDLWGDKHVTARKYKILVIYVSPTAHTKDMSTYETEGQLQKVTINQIPICTAKAT